MRSAQGYDWCRLSRSRSTQARAPHARGRRQQRNFSTRWSSQARDLSPPPSREFQSALPPLLAPVFAPPWLPALRPGPGTRPARPRVLQWAAPPGGVSTREPQGQCRPLCAKHSRGPGAEDRRSLGILDLAARDGRTLCAKGPYLRNRFVCENVMKKKEKTRDAVRLTFPNSQVSFLGSGA